MSWILAGDVGGTKTNLALVKSSDRSCTLEAQATFSSQKSDTKDTIASYIQKMGVGYRIDCASIALAGPVREGRCKITNLPWIIDAKELKSSLSIPRVLLLNDLEAGAYAIDRLPASAFCTLQAGERQQGNRALISPGTGLGEAGLYWDGKAHQPFATEGGHSDFAPIDELQLRLARYLIARFQHASYERVLSGPGIYHLFEFLRDAEGYKVEPKISEEMQQGSDPAHVISHAGLAQDSPICQMTLDLFCTLLGQEAGNLALKFLAQGGIYLGGGIPPKLLPLLQQRTFLMSFTSKGRFTELLRTFPIQIVLEDRASLIGAAAYAQCMRES